MDPAKNVCSDPVILAKEVEHLGKVLCFNNYPQWLINKWGKLEKSGPLIHPDTGNKIKKQFFVSVPYFPGKSESFKKVFKCTTIQVCFKAVNTLKSMLMHPKDKIPINQKEGCCLSLGNTKQMGVNLLMSGETSRALERGSRNTVSPRPQPYSNTVLTSTTSLPSIS